MHRVDDSKLNKTARIAGVLYLILIPLGFFGMAYVPEMLVVQGDIVSTINNIIASETIFRFSLASGFLMNIVAIFLVLTLYKLFKSINKNTAVFMVVFLLLGVCISMLNEVNYFAVLQLSSIETSQYFTSQQSQYLIQLFLSMREYGSYIAAIFWGLWLFPLACLIITSRYVPAIFGWLLIIAGAGYLIDSFTLFLVPDLIIPLADYTFIGELLFPLWLLIKGVNVKQ